MSLHKNVMDMAPHDVFAHALSLATIGGVVYHWLPLVYGIPPAMYYAAMFLETPMVARLSKRVRTALRARQRARFQRQKKRKSTH